MDGDDDMPWGWWLRARREHLEDADGRRWSSVREAYWEGHLRFPRIHVAPEQHEMLLRVLAAINRRPSNAREIIHDIFSADLMSWRFYMCWLGSIGLLELGSGDGLTGGTTVFDAPLSKEGQRVLRMLRATSDADLESLSFADIVAGIEASARTVADDAREAALVAFERQTARQPYVFAREMVGRSPVVTLTGMGTGARLPVKRVMWTQSFSDVPARDDLFAFLAERVDRWDDWGRMAYERGAAAFTQHLLGLLLTRPSTVGA